MVPIKYDPGGVSSSAMDALRRQQIQELQKMDVLQKMAEMDKLMAGEKMAQSSVVEYTLRIRPGVNDGFAVYLDNELFIAASINQLADVIIAAIGRKKIKA
jgi:hypothetical protein